jgi:hypothetical protein
MIYLLAALQRFAEQRGDGLLPELADRLREMRGLSDGRLTTINGDAADQRGEKDVDKSEERRKPKRVEALD